MLRAALLGQRGATLLAVLAVAIGASVASAMMHVTGDISRRLAHELRTLGPNLLVVPPVGSAIGAGAAPTGIHAAPFHRDRPSCDRVVTHCAPSQ